MEPSFYDHEYLIIDEISYRFNDPKRGDVIVFRYPLDPQEYFIKRIIGLPGEKIQIKEGKVYLYNNENPTGKILEEAYLEEGMDTYSSTNEIISLDKDEYFILGDNRNASKDSRVFGPVKRSFVIGRVLLRGWPFNRAGLIDGVEYGYY